MYLAEVTGAKIKQNATVTSEATEMGNTHTMPFIYLPYISGHSGTHSGPPGRQGAQLSKISWPSHLCPGHWDQKRELSARCAPGKESGGLWEIPSWLFLPRLGRGWQKEGGGEDHSPNLLNHLLTLVSLVRERYPK